MRTYVEKVVEYRRLRREGKDAEAEALIDEHDRDGVLRSFAEFSDALVAAIDEALGRGTRSAT